MGSPSPHDSVSSSVSRTGGPSSPHFSLPTSISSPLPCPHEEDDTNNKAAQRSSTESLESTPAVVSIPEALLTTKSTDVVHTAEDVLGSLALKESA